MTEAELTAFISTTAGMILSLLFSYIPGVNTWYASLDSDKKRLIMGGALLGVALLMTASSCANLWVYFPCTTPGLMKFVQVFVSALVGNQAAYTITPKATAVNALKEAQG